MDILNNDAFGVVQLTQAMNLIPHQYGKLNKSGMFKPVPIVGTTVVLELKNHVINLLQSVPRGAPAPQSQHGKRKVITLDVPHIPLEDAVLPSQVQGVRKFGTNDQMETVNEKMMEFLAENHLKFDITWEHLKRGATKGVIMDGDGVTVLHNLFTLFGIEQKVFNFNFASEDTDVGVVCRAVCRHVEENLLGDTYTEIRADVGKTFFDALVTHPSVTKFFLNWQAAAQAANIDPRKGFFFNGITFSEEPAKAPAAGTGDIINFVDDEEGYVYPFGTLATCSEYYAPGDFDFTVNTLGEPIYVVPEARKYNKGTDIWMESNPLAIFNKPGALGKLTGTYA